MVRKCDGYRYEDTKRKISGGRPKSRAAPTVRVGGLDVWRFNVGCKEVNSLTKPPTSKLTMRDFE
jgi:hypothetical protein